MTDWLPPHSWLMTDGEDNVEGRTSHEWGYWTRVIILHFWVGGTYFLLSYIQHVTAFLTEKQKNRAHLHVLYLPSRYSRYLDRFSTWVCSIESTPASERWTNWVHVGPCRAVVRTVRTVPGSSSVVIIFSERHVCAVESNAPCLARTK